AGPQRQFTAMPLRIFRISGHDDEADAIAVAVAVAALTDFDLCPEYEAVDLRQILADLAPHHLGVPGLVVGTEPIRPINGVLYLAAPPPHGGAILVCLLRGDRFASLVIGVGVHGVIEGERNVVLQPVTVVHAALDGELEFEMRRAQVLRQVQHVATDIGVLNFGAQAIDAWRKRFVVATVVEIEKGVHDLVPFAGLDCRGASPCAASHEAAPPGSGFFMVVLLTKKTRSEMAGIVILCPPRIQNGGSSRGGGLTRSLLGARRACWRASARAHCSSACRSHPVSLALMASPPRPALRRRRRGAHKRR